MMKSRIVLAALGGLLVAAPALANVCMRAEERNALNVRALQSYLMVTALSCQRGESYNQFVRRFSAELGMASRTTSAYFQRAHGAQGRSRLDVHNTNLANEHSEDGIRAGSFFCRDGDSLFRQVLATPGPQLAQFAVQWNIPQNLTADECPAAGTAAPARPRTARR